MFPLAFASAPTFHLVETWLVLMFGVWCRYLPMYAGSPDSPPPAPHVRVWY